MQKYSKFAIPWLPLVLALALGGCGSSAALPLPTPQPSATPHVVAVADPALEWTVGRLSAVQYLLEQTDSMLASASAAQSNQLPLSAKSNVADASNDMAAAYRVFNRTSVPSSYRKAQLALQHALQWYSPAVYDALSRPNQSQTEANQGHVFLQQATQLLQRSPEANLAGTIAAMQAALAAATYVPPSRRPSHPAAKRPAHPGSVRARTVRKPVSSPTPVLRITRPTIVKPTPKPAATRRTKPQPTATPVYTRAVHRARPVHHRAKPKIPSAWHTFLHDLAASDADAASAQKTLTRCQAYLLSLSLGTDPLGSAKILKCVDRAMHRLDALARSLTPAAHLAVPAAALGSLADAVHASHQAKAHLQPVAGQVQAVQLDRASAALTASLKAVTSAQNSLAQAKQALHA